MTDCETFESSLSNYSRHCLRLPFYILGFFIFYNMYLDRSLGNRDYFQPALQREEVLNSITIEEIGSRQLFVWCFLTQLKVLNFLVFFFAENQSIVIRTKAGDILHCFEYSIAYFTE